MLSDKSGDVDGEAGVGKATPNPGRFVESSALFGSGTLVHIRHGGHVYQLRKTRNGKLILTK